MSAILDVVLNEATKTGQVNFDQVYPVIQNYDKPSKTLYIYYGAAGGTNMQSVTFPYPVLPYTVEIFEGNPPTNGMTTTSGRKMKVGVGN